MDFGRYLNVFVFVYVCSWVFRTDQERRYIKTLVYVDETLKNTTEDVTKYVTEYFGGVNVALWPVNLEIIIGDILVENTEDRVGSFPFIYPKENGVSLQTMALFGRMFSTSDFDIVVALTGLLEPCVDIKPTDPIHFPHEQ